MLSNKEIRPLKNPISSFVVSDFEEEKSAWNVFFRFKLNGVQYRMYLYEQLGKGHAYVISSVFHEKQKCQFCLGTFKDDGHCYTLYDREYSPT